MKSSKKVWGIVLVILLCLIVLALVLWFGLHQAGLFGVPGDLQTPPTTADGADNIIDDPWSEDDTNASQDGKQAPAKPGTEAPAKQNEAPTAQEKAPAGQAAPAQKSDKPASKENPQNGKTPTEEELATSDEGWTKLY